MFYTKLDKNTETQEIRFRNEEPKDFLTLIRFTIMFKLCNLGNI